MQVLNPLTKFVADFTYISKTFTKIEGFDNSTDVIELAINQLSYRIEYAVVLLTSGLVETGVLDLILEGGLLEIAGHQFSFISTEIGGISFSTEILPGVARLLFTKTAVGENTALFYRVSSTPIS